MPPIQDDDLLIIGRPDPDPNEEPQTMKVTWGELKAVIQQLIDDSIP